MLHAGECLTSAPFFLRLITALHVLPKRILFFSTYFNTYSICSFGKRLPWAAFSSLYFGTEIIIVFMSYQVNGYKINRNILRRRGIINFKFPRSLPAFSFLRTEEQSKSIMKHRRNSQLLTWGKLDTFILNINLTIKKWLSVLTFQKPPVTWDKLC